MIISLLTCFPIYSALVIIFSSLLELSFHLFISLWISNTSFCAFSMSQFLLHYNLMRHKHKMKYKENHSALEHYLACPKLAGIGQLTIRPVKNTNFQRFIYWIKWYYLRYFSNRREKGDKLRIHTKLKEQYFQNYIAVDNVKTAKHQ